MKKHLHEVLALPPEKCYVTDLQVQAWAEWLIMDMNRPGKAERYATQTACEVRRSWIKTPSAVNPDDFLMRFSPNSVIDGSQPDDPDDETALEAEKKAAKAAFGGRSRYTPPPPREPDPPDEDQWVDDPWERKGDRRMEDDG